MEEANRAAAELQRRGIPHKVFRHAGVVKSLEQAALERGQQPRQVVRSIVFRVAADEFVMVLTAGPAQIPWKELRAHLSQRRLTMATPAEVKRATGFEIGTVSPFGMPREMRILVDQNVMQEAEISLGSGEAGVAIIMTPSDLLRGLPQAEIIVLTRAP